MSMKQWFKVLSIGFRTKYSIFINYSSYILHVFLSTLFTVIVARRLCAKMFGLWATIVGVDAVLSSIVYVWAWMNTRLYVRGVKDYIKTSFTLTAIYVFLSMPLMVAVGLAYNHILGWGLNYFTLATLPLVFNGFYVFLSNSVIAIQPYYLGYGNFLRDVVKVVFAYLTVYVLKLDLQGAILSVLFSSIAVDVFFISVIIKHRFPLSFNLDYLNRVLKNAYIPLVSIAYSMVASLEKPIATAISRLTEITAYLNVASIPRNIIVYAGSAIGVSIAPKLLSEPTSSDIEDFLSIGILLNTWIFVILLVYANPILSLYNPVYLESMLLYILYSIDSLILALSFMISTIPVSVEKRDLYDEGKALVKTPLFKIPMYNLVRSIIAVSLGSAGLYISLRKGLSTVESLILYPMGWLVMDVFFLVYTYRLAIKTASFRFPWKELLCVAVASATSASLASAYGGNRVVLNRLSVDLVKVLPSALIFISTYVLVAVSISRRYRALVKHLLSVILKTRSQRC